MSTVDPTDDPRLQRAVDGDDAVLEELLREFGPKVTAELSIDSRWRSSLDPEDVMQVTYLEAYLRIGTLRTRTAHGFRGWLARIAANNLADAVRALRRDKRPEAHGPGVRIGETSSETLMATLSDGHPTVGTMAAGREAIERMHAAIARLPASYRRVVEQVDLAQRPVAELAAELGRSAGAVHMLRARAHDRLREMLGSPTRFF